MGPGPYRPALELRRALERGELDMAIAHARELARKRGRPIDLDLALALVALVAAQRPRDYDAWALRWLGRWVGEGREPTIEKAAELAASLADLPAEPQALQTLRSWL